MGLPQGTVLPSEIEDSIFAKQVNDYSWLRTFFDKRKTELDRDVECHTHQWLFDVCEQHVNDGDGGTALAAYRGNGGGDKGTRRGKGKVKDTKARAKAKGKGNGTQPQNKS